jgi:hypothetical protein
MITHLFAVFAFIYTPFYCSFAKKTGSTARYCPSFLLKKYMVQCSAKAAFGGVARAGAQI